MTVARAFNTDFNQHVGLIHNLARKGWGRLLQAHVDEEYTDVFQQMCLSYTKAAAAFDAGKGVSFTAYMGRAIWNEFNRYAEKRIGERMGLGLTSIEHLSEHSDAEDVDMMETLTSGERSPEEELERKQMIVHNLRRLSPTAKFLVAKLISPPPELEAAFAAWREDKVAACGRAPRDIGLSFIGDHYGVERARLKAAICEIKEVYGA